MGVVTLATVYTIIHIIHNIITVGNKLSISCTCRLVVLLAFWPEITIHNGISSSANDVQDLIPEIAGHVVDNALLSIEQRRLTPTM